MNAGLLNESAIQITFFLFAAVIIVGLLIAVLKLNNAISRTLKRRELSRINKQIASMTPEDVEKVKKRKEELEFQLKGSELSGDLYPSDPRGLVDRVGEASVMRFIPVKRSAAKTPFVQPRARRLILWYIVCATFWLLFGTTVGEYVGFKFVLPDLDHFDWLSFGRLRPVHTNAVFWGWSSIAMVGFAYYVVPRVGNTEVYSVKLGYYTLILMNAAVFIGSILLMAGVSNSGGEYREYIWPVMLLWAIGVAISSVNFYRTIVMRKVGDIYVANWYIMGAMMYILIIAFVGYFPVWQKGLGVTIIQGYYMHQAIGMWFMLLTLGLMYYFLPQQLNKPIYSYSLGVIAFWTQILFYTLIGTHHYIFSPIQWWLQTVAIVASVGMVIPVAAGTANFLLTFKGSWYKLKTSYTLPFYLTGIIFYFTGSMQGSVEALRFSNLVWHFTDFTVAHSHLTMYGIIAFMLWGFTYTMVPRLTGKEPPRIMVGVHFWLALIGLIFYTFSLMYGATEKGMMWRNKLPFIDSLAHMYPYWLWRALGGTLMYISHFVFAYNLYRMIHRRNEILLPTAPADILVKLKDQEELK